MRAQTIDHDEILTGERREAVYAGVGCLFSKPMISVVLTIVPLIILTYGLDVPPEGVDSTTSLYPTLGYPNALLGVAIAGLLAPAILATIGAISWRWYPLTREVLEGHKVILDEIHAKKREERLNADGTSKFLTGN